MLELRKVTKRFGSTTALDGVTFSLDAGAPIVVTGPNAAGKTTLLRVIATLSRPTSGEVIFNGENIYSLPEAVWGNIAYLPSPPGLYREMTVEGHLAYRAHLRGLSGMRLHARMRHVIEAFDLRELRPAPIAGLSQGQAKRVALADAFLTDAKIVLLDEPFAGLDDEHINSLVEIFSAAAKHSILMIATHRRDFALSFCQTEIALCRGALQQADAEETEEV